MFVLSIKLFQGVLVIDDFVLEISYDFLKLMDMSPSLIFDLVALLIALILRPSHVEDVLGSGLSKRSTYFLHSLLVDCLKHLFSCLVGLLLEEQVIESASETMHLHVVQEKFVQTGHEFACGGLSVQFGEGM